MQLPKLAIVQVALLGLAACAQPGRPGGVSPLPASIAALASDAGQPLDGRRVQLTGRVFAEAPMSTFLAPLDQPVPPGMHLADFDRCLQLLVSRREFEALRGLNGEEVRVTGRYLRLGVDPGELLVLLRFKGRQTRPECGYLRGMIPLLHVESWSSD